MKESEHMFTIGIEEEFQIVDPETRELRSHIQEILAQGKMILKEQVKPEMHQSVGSHSKVRASRGGIRFRLFFKQGVQDDGGPRRLLPFA